MKHPDISRFLERGVRAHRAGRLQDALAAYRKALRRWPDDAEALSLYGLALAHAGRLEEAEAPLRKAVGAEPDQAGFRLNLIEFLERSEQHEAGLQEARAVTARQPRLARGWEKAGDLGRALGRTGDAIEYYRTALALEPRSFGCAVKLARLGIEAGDVSVARQALAAADRIDPQHEAVHRARLELLTAQRAWSDLIKLALARIRSHPQDRAARYALSRGYFEEGRYRLAMEAYAPIVEDSAEAAAVQTAFARLCLYAHEFDAAMAALEKAESLDPDLPEMLAAKGMMLTYLGRLSEAEAYTRRCLAADPRYAPAYTQLTELTEGRFTDEEIATLAELSAAAGVPEEHRVTAAFALGRAMDARGDTGAAFDAYRQANLLSRQRAISEGRPYDPARAEERADRIISRFAGTPRHGAPLPDGPRPIFVVGMPRSGTTLVESVLSAHSRVIAGGELTMMPQILEECLALDDSSPLDTDALRTWAAAYYREAPRSPGADHITDKQPLNFEAAGLILRMFPHAVILNVRRDPLETGLSIFSHEFTKLWTFAHRLEDIGHYYEQYARLVSHWEQCLGEQFVTIQYEDFAGDMDRMAPTILQLCGLPWEDQCASFQQQQRPIATLSAVQARQPVTIRIGKATRYRAFLGPLVETLRSANIDPATGALLR